MIRKWSELPGVVTERIRGGKGQGSVQTFFKAEEFSTPLCAFNVLTLEPGSSVGYHQHVDSEEVYWILEGQGLAKDNDQTLQLKQGDALLTNDRNFHSIENNGTGPLKILTVMANQPKK
jgi:mannose-6-phosphate isomerase-like protein (cupin superfamily)